MKKGFTLVEFLVVVLVIGLLAAVALPQYRMAVYKTRLARLLPIMKSIKQANQLFFLSNGYYTNDITQWDMALPEGTTVALSEGEQVADITLPDGSAFQTIASALPGRSHPRVQGVAPQVPARLITFYEENKWGCFPSGSAEGWRLCKAIGCGGEMPQNTYCAFSF